MSGPKLYKSTFQPDGSSHILLQPRNNERVNKVRVSPSTQKSWLSFDGLRVGRRRQTKTFPPHLL